MTFQWGAATSSHQVEGGNRLNDWWAWEEKGNVEGKISSGRATDHWNRFQEDLQIAQNLNLNSYRFSIEWSRLEPNQGEWNTEAEDWYYELVLECERRGLRPMLTLHHFTLPQWLAEKGGLLNPEFAFLFQKFVSKVAARIGKRVPLWCTVNEPMVLIVGAYVGSFMPPAQFSPKSVPVACVNLFRAHFLAYETLHRELLVREGPFKNEPLEVGFAHNMIDFRPARSWHPIEKMMTAMFRHFYNRSWLDAVAGKAQHFGMRGLLPHAGQVVEARGKKSADFIGINYYTKCYLHWGKLAAQSEFGRPDFIPLGVSFKGPYDEHSDLGWAIHPAGLGRMLRFVSRYNLPIYITENGIADEKDKYRPSYLVSHLMEVARAIERGIDIRGYYYWSLLDNFEWIKGFGPRFGITEVNYENFKRTVRPSGNLLKRIIARHKEAGKTRPSTALLRAIARESAE